MRIPAAAVLLAAFLAACASVPPSEPRGEVLKRLLASTVQLQAEREGGVRRAASGVVVASDETHPRSWILTAGHFVEPLVSQSITVRSAGRARRDRARVVASSRDPDLALLLLEGRVLPAVKLRRGAALGDGVWVVAYPWGRSLTVASGIVSQVDPPGDDAPLAGNPRLVDVSVSYGASGGGVFDAATGELLGLVEGHRTARITLPRDPTASVQVPVAGETIVIPVSVMARFLTEAGLATVVPAGAPGSDAPASR